MLTPSDQVTAPSADTVASQSLNDAWIINQQNIVRQSSGRAAGVGIVVRLRAMKAGSRADWWQCFDAVWHEGKDKDKTTLCLLSCVVKSTALFGEICTSNHEAVWLLKGLLS
jgi:hypothetical protein